MKNSELFYVEIIIFPVIFDGQTPPGHFFGDQIPSGTKHKNSIIPVRDDLI